MRGRSGDDGPAGDGGEKTPGPGQAGIRQEATGSETNIAGSVQGPVLSGQFDGPVATGDGAEAVDLRGSVGAKYKPTIQREKLRFQECRHLRRTSPAEARSWKES